MAGSGCYDISGNDVDCVDPNAYYDANFQTLAGNAPGTSVYNPSPSNIQNTDYAAPSGSSTAAQVGVNADGGNSSSIGSAISSVTKAIGSVFGQVYSTTNPAKPGTVINPATGQPYSIGQQLQLSGIFANPLLLIIIIIAIVMASKHK